MGLMFTGMVIAFVSPQGEIREEPFIGLFYASIGGVIVIVIYSSYKDRKERQRLNKERRRSKK